MVSGTPRQWLLPALISLGALCLIFIGSRLGGSVNAQAQLPAGPQEGIIVIPVQIDRDSYGLAMVDTIGQTMWIYELNNRGPAHSRLRLLAARSWRYDRMLQQYNTAEPKPEQIKELLGNMEQPRENLGEQPQKDSDVNIMEMAEPNNSGSGDSGKN